MQSNRKQAQKENVITKKWKEPNRCGRFPQQGKHEVLTKWAEGSSFHIQAPAFEYSNNLGGRVNQYSTEYHARRGRRSFMKATEHAGKTRGGATRMCLRVECGGQVLGGGGVSYPSCLPLPVDSWNPGRTGWRMCRKISGHNFNCCVANQRSMQLPITWNGQFWHLGHWVWKQILLSGIG